MSGVLQPDICVLGAGVAGRRLAVAAASSGASVVVAGAGQDRCQAALTARLALCAAGRQAHALRQGGFGVAAHDPEVDIRALIRHARSAGSALDAGFSSERLRALGATVLEDSAGFVDARTVRAGEIDVRAARFVVAPGSLPVLPPVEGLDGVGALTEDDLPQLTRRPGHLAVVGAGAEAVELAQAFRRFGSAVTLVTSGPFLPGWDGESAAVVLRRLAVEGVRLLDHRAVGPVEPRGRSGVRITVEGAAGEEAIDATHLLVAAGRRPDVERLGLVKARLAMAGGLPRVDAGLRTSNRRVHLLDADPARASAEAERLLRPLLSGAAVPDEARPRARLVATEPALASVGVTEPKRGRKAAAFRILRWPYSESLAARMAGLAEGHVKLTVDDAGRLLGASIVGARAGELIDVWAVALAKGLTVGDMAAHLPPQGGLGEIGKSAAMTYFVTKAKTSFAGRLAGFLRRPG